MPLKTFQRGGNECKSITIVVVSLALRHKIEKGLRAGTMLLYGEKIVRVKAAQYKETRSHTSLSLYSVHAAL